MFGICEILKLVMWHSILQYIWIVGVVYLYHLLVTSTSGILEWTAQCVTTYNCSTCRPLTIHPLRVLFLSIRLVNFTSSVSSSVFFLSQLCHLCHLCQLCHLCHLCHFVSLCVTLCHFVSLCVTLCHFVSFVPFCVTMCHFVSFVSFVSLCVT
jgi:hypothetical protein